MNERLEYTSGGGVLSLFGAPFFLAGLMTMGMAFVAATNNGHPMEIGERAFMFFFSMPFIAVGAGFLFGRSGTIISKREGTLKTWWGLLIFPLSTTVKKLEAFTRVQIIPEVRGGKNKTTFYVVYLSGNNNERLEIKSHSEYNKARALGEEVAKYLNFGILDTSSGQGIFRPAGTLDQSVREQALSKGETVSLPEMPDGCRISFTPSDSDRSGFFVLPAPGFIGQFLVVIPIVFFLFIFLDGFIALPLLTTFWNTTTFPGGKFLLPLLFAGSGLIPLIGCAIYIISQARSVERIGVSRQGMIIEKTGFFFNAKTRITGKEIEELFINKRNFSGIKKDLSPQGGVNQRKPQVVGESALNGTGFSGIPGSQNLKKFFSPDYIVLRGDKQTVHCGTGLTLQELEWLKDALKFYLVGEPPTL
ncbi:MAG: hypothetical protein WA705_27495 [Candidatus Ozemobacteraceae bacterium]